MLQRIVSYTYCWSNYLEVMICVTNRNGNSMVVV